MTVSTSSKYLHFENMEAAFLVGADQVKSIENVTIQMTQIF